MAKIIHNDFLPFGKFYAINLCGLIFVRKGARPSARTINHEEIHTHQQHEMLFLPFFVWYVIEWLFRLIQYRDPMKAYYNISFEREAYRNQDNLHYRATRPFWAWLAYLKR